MSFSHSHIRPGLAGLLPALALGAVLLGGVSASRAQAADAPPAARVGVVAAAPQNVYSGADFVGRVDAIERVDLVARVKGFLKSVKFTEGQNVKVGDVLFEIEPDLFKADVDAAQGALERGKAAKELAEIQLKRAAELLVKQAGTAVQRDQAAAADRDAAGAILSAEAALATAKINLGYTTITAPISGRIGRTNLTVGNVVGPESGALATIVSEDPTYVTFPVSQRDFLRVTGDAKTNLSDVGVTLTFPDGAVYPDKGRVNFVDVKVDRATDTIAMRATFPNPGGRLRDGQLVRVRLENDAPQSQLVIPQAALLADKDGPFVFVVEDGKAMVRRVKLGAEVGAGMAIEEGLKQGDLVVTEGLTNLRPGMAVLASPVASRS